MLLLSGCGGQTYEPASIEEGVDTCAVCNMMISDDQFAVQLIQKDGKVYKFDDIGDLYVWKDQNGTEQIGMEFVRDYYTMEWIPLSDAYFVYDKDFKTPMAYGVYSFKDEDSAKKLMAEEGKGRLMTAGDLEQHGWERNMEMMEMMKEEHGHHHDHNQDHDTEHDHDEDHGHDHGTTSPEGASH